MVYDRCVLFTRTRKPNETLVVFPAELTEIHTLESELVRDLSKALMNSKTTEILEVQKKYPMQKPTSENLVKDVTLIERGNSTSKSLNAFQSQVKTEPTFPKKT